MKEEEQQARWNQAISQQKKFLKTQSKNHLVRVIVEMSIRALQQEAMIEQLNAALNPQPEQTLIPTQEGAKNEESTTDSQPNAES